MWTRSFWWLLAVFAFDVLREPLQVFLLEIAKRVGPAIGKRLAERLRQGRRSKRRSNPR